MSREKTENGMRLMKVPFEGTSGKPEQVLVSVPDSDDPEEEQVAEAAQYIKTLDENGNLEHEGKESQVSGATHRLRRKKDGTQVLERIGFSAV